MKITVYNDTGQDWVMHATSEKGANGETRIPHQSMVNFEVSEPHTREVFIKVWDNTLLVRVTPDLRSRLGQPIPKREYVEKLPGPSPRHPNTVSEPPMATHHIDYTDRLQV